MVLQPVTQNRFLEIMIILLQSQGFRIEAIWGKTTAEAENVAQILDIPFSTRRIDDVLLRKDVDLILILENGSIKEIGSYNELLQRNGALASLSFQNTPSFGGNWEKF